MKRIFIIIALFVFSVGVSTVFGQKAKADKCFSSFDYKDAIPLYLKVIKSSPNDTGSIIHLAYSYAVIKDYTDAELYYARVAGMNGIPPIVHYNYAEALKYNGKIDAALVEFTKYLALVPADTAARGEIKNCDRLKQSYQKEYQVAGLDTINTPYSEFSPVIYNDSLVFMSDRVADNMNFARNKYNGGNYFKVFVAAPANKGFAKPSLFSSQINGVNSDYNIGPVSFTGNGNEAFFTEVAAIQGKGFVNHMKIYYCERSGGKWEKRSAFAYNSDSYSVMHPAISADGKKLYFASDMPGGFGGMDIYVCVRTADGWSKPQNLGANVNTGGNECFPYMRNDSTLFFSSDKHFNYGGLDIFSCREVNGVWTDVHNLGADVNSSADDFGICFNRNNRTGYFSSSRTGGKGRDDIYSFTFIGDNATLEGKVLCSFNSKDIAAGVEVSVYTEDGVFLAIAKTDSLGGFKFNNLPGEKDYLVRISENDPRFAGKKRFYLTDKNGKIVSVSRNDGRFNYNFSKLPPDLTKLSKMDAPPSNLAGNLLRGDGSSAPLANVAVELVDTTGRMIDSVETNEFGSFLFNEVSPDGQYNFKVFMTASKTPPCPKILVTDRNGNVIQEIFLTIEGNYQFRVLAKDTSVIKRMSVEDPQLRFQMKAGLVDENKKPVNAVKVKLNDRTGKTLFTTMTDSAGIFVFSDLPVDSTYIVELDTNDTKLRGLRRLYLTDANHHIIRELILGRDFKFKVLPADFNKMGKVNVYDPWLAALHLKGTKKESDLNIIENIYFDYQKWDILPAAANTLSKVVQVMQKDPLIKIELDAYTDSRGSDDANLKMSQKRADAAVNYMVQHGISKTRVSGKGLGKANPINNCGDPNVHCTEEQFAQNRRIEFKITRANQK